jgi:hypothetical protein
LRRNHIVTYVHIGECPCVTTGTYNITITYVLYVSVATHGHSPSLDINCYATSPANMEYMRKEINGLNKFIASGCMEVKKGTKSIKWKN